MIDEAIMSSVHEAGSAEAQGVKHEEKMKAHLHDVVDAFDRARSFLGWHDDNVAMSHFLQYEDTAVKLQPMVPVPHKVITWGLAHSTEGNLVTLAQRQVERGPSLCLAGLEQLASAPRWPGQVVGASS